MKVKKIISIVVFLQTLMFTVCAFAAEVNEVKSENKVGIGIAWRADLASDYLLMAYCIDKDIMQALAVPGSVT